MVLEIFHDEWMKRREQKWWKKAFTITFTRGRGCGLWTNSTTLTEKKGREKERERARQREKDRTESHKKSFVVSLFVSLFLFCLVFFLSVFFYIEKLSSQAAEQPGSPQGSILIFPLPLFIYLSIQFLVSFIIIIFYFKNFFIVIIFFFGMFLFFASSDVVMWNCEKQTKKNMKKKDYFYYYWPDCWQRGSARWFISFVCFYLGWLRFYWMSSSSSDSCITNSKRMNEWDR